MDKMHDDFLTGALAGGMFAALANATKNMQDKLARLALTYSDEDAALAQARKMANLKPGDKIYIPDAKPENYIPAIFVRWSDDGMIHSLVYNESVKQLWPAKTSPTLVLLDGD